MKSGDLARMAGVSVRALRHYHAIGILPEPPRHENGYRDYDASSLLRVLRIRQLASLGFSLEQIGPLLDALDEGRGESDAEASLLEGQGSRDTDRVLDELDTHLAEQIRLLEAQRATIARLRADRISPDVPDRAAGALDALAGLASRLPEPGFLDWMFTSADRLAMGIAVHLYSDGDLAEMERVFRAIPERGLMGEYVAASREVEALPADASPEARDHATRRCAAFLDRVLDCFSAENWLRPEAEYERVLASVAKQGYNEAQKDVSGRVFCLLAERLASRERVEGSSALDPDATS